MVNDMQERQQIYSLIHELLESQPLAVLATRSDRYPYCSLVAFAHTNNCREILFVTSRDTNKYKNLINCHEVSLLIDNRQNNPEDFSDAAAVTVLGSAVEVSGKELTRAKSVYLKRHSYLQEFISAPQSAMFVIVVEKYIFVRQFQKVVEYIID
jgi:nitroimidazol reductase NimA-like FMN-containing flavoprotein (pyridoxamine 5'-phosphate oxidase superfamily)